MKNILLATTALVMTAGFASAEVTFSGSAGAGISTTAAASGVVYSGIDLNVAASTTTDSGMTISVSEDFGGGSMLDLLDDFKVEAQTSDLDTPTITIATGGATIKIENNAIDNLYDGDLDAGDIGVSGAFGDLTWAITTETNSADTGSSLTTAQKATTNTYAFGYTMGAIGLSLAGTDNDQTAASASYTMGTTTFTVSSDKSGTTTVVKGAVALDLNGASVSYKGGDDDSWDVAVGYTLDGASLAYSTSEAKDWQATAVYALGGGASIEAGVNDLDTSHVGVSFKF